jgi:hypothetical protein
LSIQVIGAGFGRTGTASLKVALEQLGYAKCYHMFEVMGHPEHVDLWWAAHRGEPVDWDALYEGYQATVDWPSCNLWEEHAAYYPDARVILSTRDPDGWYDSVINTIYPTSRAFRDAEDEMGRRFGAWIDDIVWKGVFDDRFEDKAYAIDVFLAHEAKVKATLPPERLLVFDAREGWAPLCAFLGKDAPAEPYPRTNTREEFFARREERVRGLDGES